MVVELPLLASYNYHKSSFIFPSIILLPLTTSSMLWIAHPSSSSIFLISSKLRLVPSIIIINPIVSTSISVTLMFTPSTPSNFEILSAKSTIDVPLIGFRTSKTSLLIATAHQIH
ncbi:hypothetical protein SSOP1_0582 [Saccharolobus solfataricus]|uniref:Uncharacterized protein ORF-c21_013 n=1 Tax=Saccharolobus solfataricus TaxID=2287 RepID=Q9UWY9_SACSO|nr:hypothetical protein [Saccharolobus solfataricus P2]SAI84137.1 hypothetical protein SSOP1_0582 [Saccharolobus solfataricus]